MMSDALAYRNGHLLPAEELTVPVYDAGFVQGVTVTEQLRTFGGKLFRSSQHWDRLWHSLEIVEIDPGPQRDELAAAAESLVAHNHRLLAPGDDLGLSVFVTPGAYPTFSPLQESRPMVAMHTYLLPFHLWSSKYEQGQTLAVADTMQVPPECWPSELKCRSRMHYYLADRQAALKYPGARALLLDRQQTVMEVSTANIVIYRDREGFLSPPKEKTLPGVSMAVLTELADDAGIPFTHCDLGVDDVACAEEVLLSSTSCCLLPVVALNGAPIGSGRPGEIFHRVLQRWNELVGLDIREQARQFGNRSGRTDHESPLDH